jgi:hypothetical protein
LAGKGGDYHAKHHHHQPYRYASWLRYRENDYRASVTAYMECLATIPPKDCERLRFVMEAEEHQYSAVAGETGGGNSAPNTNAHNR